VPPVTTTGSGTGALTVDRTTGALSGSITVAGLSGTANAAHIHSGFAGTNGGIIVTLVADAGTPGKFDVPAGTVLDPIDPTRLASFLAGGMYVNAHTTANPAGEVRAQVVAGDIDVVRCVASGDFEVPPVTTAASGIAYTTVSTGSINTGAVVANVRTSSFADANAAHLHRAFAGLNGGVIVPLVQTGGAGSDLWAGVGVFDAAQLSAYQNGEIYVNVHNPANPGGHIRSQIVPTNIRVLRFGLNGGQEVPPVSTTATATGYITVNQLSGEVEANARTVNLAGGNAAHIHQAATGDNGGVIVPLTQDAVAPELWAGIGVFTAGQLTNFLNNNTYLNVHTPTYPGGEIRGQIVLP
ncbi:MAG TPA: CHRD domain-containing protein, partial [Rhodocyclaceae bacterium]|nr:CHRD domain-containing protein [Rhodocyclaceae bacterium]